MSAPEPEGLADLAAAVRGEGSKELRQVRAQLDAATAEIASLRDLTGLGDRPVDPAQVTRMLSERMARAESERLYAASARPPLALVPAAEVWDEPDICWLVDGLIPETGIGAVFGETGTWKSFLAQHLQLCVGLGLAFMGRQVSRPGRCVYLMGEGQAGAMRRLRAAVTDMPGAGAGPPAGLDYVRIPFPLADRNAVSDLIAACLARAAGQPVSLVVFDAAADFYAPGASENSAADMEPVIAAAKRIARELGCFVLLIAHTGHGGRGEDGEAGHIRGTSRFGQAWDFEAQASRDESRPGCGWLRVTKVKEDEAGQRIPFHVAAVSGSLAVRPGLPQEGGSSDGAAEPEALPALSPAEARIWAEVIRYVIAHGAGDGLSFRRIDQGVSGTQAIKRRMLDRAVAWRLLDQDERGRFRLPDPGGDFVRSLFA